MDGLEEEDESNKKRRVCECGKEAVEKVVGPRSENRGLRYLCCDKFVFFGKKKNYCRFFEWVDEPRITKKGKREVQALKHQRKGAASVTTAHLQPAPRTRSVGKGLENQCKTIDGLQVHKENFELEMRVSENSPLQSQIHEDSVDALIDSPIAARDNLTEDSRPDVFVENVSARKPLLRAITVADQTSDGDCVDAEPRKISPTSAVEPETDRSKLTVTIQQNRSAAQDVQDLNLGVDDTVVRGDTSITQIGLDANLNEVLKDKGFSTGLEGKQSVRGSYETLETPTCLCLRAAVLKTVKSNGPNKGLRFWVCSNSRPFYVKKKKSNTHSVEASCKFFRWVDTPLEKSDTQKDEEVQKRKELRKKKELALLS